MATRGSGNARPAFVWTLPVCPHQVAVELEIIRVLQHAGDGAPEPQQGLLYGRKMAGVTYVQAVQPIASLDRRAFVAAICRSLWPVVGYYRIRDGSAFVLEEGEIELATGLFHQPGSIVLLIERRETGPSEGAFAFWRGGTFVSNLPHSFPIDSEVLAADAQAGAGEALLPERGSAGGIFRRPASQIGALAAAALVFLGFQFAWKNKPQGSWYPEAGVSAAARNRPRTDLDISWQVDSLHNATTALLKIRDGMVQHQVPLDGGHLHQGHLIYSSESGPVSVEMAAFESDGQIVTVPVSARLLSDPLLPPVPDSPPASPVSPELRGGQRGDIPQPFQAAGSSAHEAARRQTFELQPVRPARNPARLPDPPAVQPLAEAGLQTALALPGNPMVVSPPAPVAPLPKRVAPVAEPVRHESGRLIWTGTLLRGGVVEFDGKSVSVGSLSGALPGLPITFTVSPAEFREDGLVVYTADPARNNQIELPSDHNGWNRVKFIWDPEHAHEIKVLEPPNASNRFSHLALRADARRCYVLLIEWQTAEPGRQ